MSRPLTPKPLPPKSRASNPRVQRQTPQSLGFRMPAEWEPHEATWLAWPHHTEDWPGKFAAIPWVVAEIVRHLHRHELVHVVVEDASREQRASAMLDRVGVDLSQVEFHRFSTNRSWLRDSGPTFVTNGSKLAATCWRFNAWARYNNWEKDSRLSGKMAAVTRSRAWRPQWKNRPVVLEGGSIDVNGCGMLITTEECLLGNKQVRNPGMSRQDYEQVFAEHLGIRKVLWLGSGIAGDDTGGHVDDLARFVAPRKVVTVVESNPDDANYQALRENLRRLRAMTDQDGRPLEVLELPMPRPLFFNGYRLPASYANFYVANEVVLVPTFNDPSDRTALDILRKLFPSREVVGIHCVDFAWGFGTIHCSTQQQPKAHRQNPERK